MNEKRAGFLPQKPEKPLLSEILFPELQRELQEKPSLSGNLRGLFIITVLKNGQKRDEWFLLFQGLDAPPKLSQTRPELPSLSQTFPAPTLPVVVVEISDKDILNFITGGLPGMKAFASGKIKIVGDLLVAQQLEAVFVKAGGVEKAMKFLEKTGIKRKAKL